VLCEIAVSDPLDEHGVVERTIEDLCAVGIMRSPSEVCSRWIKKLPYGYPIPTLERDQVLREAHERFTENAIYSRGRSGKFFDLN